MSWLVQKLGEIPPELRFGYSRKSRRLGDRSQDPELLSKHRQEILQMAEEDGYPIPEGNYFEEVDAQLR